jgi:hypothetical protein
MRGKKGRAIVAALALGLGLVPVLASGAAAAPHHAARPDWVYFREVVCFAPAYKSTSSPQTLPEPPCSPSSTLDLQNLQTTPDTLYGVGFKTDDVAPDQTLATIRSTPAAGDRANATVLLPGLPGTGPQRNSRLVLGPAEMTSRSIANARATKLRSGAWVVDFSTTPDGAALWDRVADENFHLVLAIDLNGEVVSAPIIEPTQSSFSGLNGLGEISGNLTPSLAMRLAHAL